MKCVIYRCCGHLKVTTETNYYAPIRDANAVLDMSDFESENEVMDYFCDNGIKRKSDFIIASHGKAEL